eukprot:3913209-Pleurochrysis_carterae.AAC.1
MVRCPHRGCRAAKWPDRDDDRLEGACADAPEDARTGVPAQLSATTHGRSCNAHARVRTCARAH